jgi:3',5'-cyclic AMP phosphodiesterase CpdA
VFLVRHGTRKTDYMRRIVHISDLHFGTTEQKLVDALVRDIEQQAPDLTVVTGDLTQRARNREFDAARDFLQRLPQPQLVVPGNHDIAPVYKPWRRLLAPFTRFRKAITGDLDGMFDDGELMVAGLNSVTPFRFKDGAVPPRRLKRLETRMRASGTKLRVVAAHHPLVEIESRDKQELVRGQKALRSALERAGVHLVLAGHLHQSFSGPAKARVGRAGSLVVVQASTSTSSRRRGHANAYNVIELEPKTVRVQVRAWNEGHIVPDRTLVYALRDGGWALEELDRMELAEAR